MSEIEEPMRSNRKKRQDEFNSDIKEKCFAENQVLNKKNISNAQKQKRQKKNTLKFYDHFSTTGGRH